uniref:Secreted protein n=1 Tax=Ixodes ricinus TaxID=34613 RepID=A0A6B0TUM7_IXORI
MLVHLSWTHLRLLLVIRVASLFAPRALDRLAVHVRIVRRHNGVCRRLFGSKPNKRIAFILENSDLLNGTVGVECFLH